MSGRHFTRDPLRASLHMYGFDYSRGTLSMNLHLDLSADDVTAPSNDGTKVGCQALNNLAEVLLLGEHDSLEAIRAL